MQTTATEIKEIIITEYVVVHVYVLKSRMLFSFILYVLSSSTYFRTFFSSRSIFNSIRMVVFLNPSYIRLRISSYSCEKLHLLCSESLFLHFVDIHVCHFVLLNLSVQISLCQCSTYGLLPQHMSVLLFKIREQITEHS